MKKLYLFLLLTTTILLLNSCIEKIENDNYAESLENGITVKQDADINFNGDYLQFKSLEVYDSICKVLSEMEYEEFQEWENEFGFKSAKTWKEEFLDELDNSDNKELQESVIRKYSSKLNYDAINQFVKYRFFANSLDRVLNIDGYVEIENSLYKFTQDNQYISYDGSKSRIEDALLSNKMKSQDIDDDPFLFVLRDNNLKSSNSVVEEGVKTVGKYRMIYSFNKIVYSTFYAFDPNTGIAWYKWGYGLNLTMSQYYDGWFGWRSDGGYYYLRDINIYWHETGVGGPSHNGPMPDKNYTRWKRSEVTHYFVDVGYVDYYMGYANFAYNLDVTFWSNGILEKNKITLNIDNKD